jgi:hypothetical protein
MLGITAEAGGVGDSEAGDEMTTFCVMGPFEKRESVLLGYCTCWGRRVVIRAHLILRDFF